MAQDRYGLVEANEVVRKALAKGDQLALITLYEVWGEGVKAWMQRALGTLATDDSLDDAVQNALVIIWKKRKQIAAYVDRIDKYFARVSINECKRILKKRGPLHRSLPELFNHLAESKRDEASRLTQEFDQFAKSLSDMELSIWREDLAGTSTAKELAEKLGSTRASIYSIRNRLKRKLKKWLDKWRKDNLRQGPDIVSGGETYD